MKNASENKLLFSNSLWIFVIRFFGTAASLALMIFYAHQLPTASYGVYQNFWVQITIVTAIANVGLGLLLFTYSAEVLRQLVLQLKKKHIILYGFLLLLIGAIFSILRSSDLSDWIENGFVHFLFFLIFSCSILLETSLIIFRKYLLLFATSILYAFAFFGIGFWVFKNGFSIIQLEQFLLIALAIKAIIFSITFVQFIKTNPQTPVQEIDTKQVRSLWLNMSIYDLLTVFVTWIDKFVISIIASSTTAAIYFNGTFPIPFIPLLLGAVANASLMQLNNSKTSLQKAGIMRQAGRLLASVVYPLFFFLLVYRSEFISLVFSEKYEASIPIFLCALLILPIRAYSHTAILQNAHQGKKINIGILIDFIVAIAVIYPLYLLFGLAGIALSFVISTYVQVVYYLYHSAKKLEVPMLSLIPLKNWLLKALGFGTLIFVLHFLLKNNTAIISMATTLIIISIVSIILLRYETNKKQHEPTS